MPKRMIDDSLLNSPSMAVLSPRAQDAFHRFVLLADDFGCLEAHPRVLLAKGWPDRRDVTEQDISGWIDEYATIHPPGEPPMAVVWEERARRYAYLTGWTGPHGQRRRTEYRACGSMAEQKGSKRRTPTPPEDMVAAAMRGIAPGEPGFPPGNAAGTHREAALESVNDSVPARETQIPAAEPPGKSRNPAPAVPVAVAVAVPAAAAAGRTAVEADDEPPPRKLVVEDYADSVTEFRRLMADRLVVPGDWIRQGKEPRVIPELAAEIARVGGPAAAVEACTEAAFASSPRPQFMRWYLTTLRGASGPPDESDTLTATEIADAMRDVEVDGDRDPDLEYQRREREARKLALERRRPVCPA